MSCFKHPMDANICIRENRALFKAKRTKRSEMRMMYAKAVTCRRGELSDIELPHEEIEKIKAEIRARMRREQRRMVIATTVIFILIVALIYLLFVLF